MRWSMGTSWSGFATIGASAARVDTICASRSAVDLATFWCMTSVAVRTRSAIWLNGFAGSASRGPRIIPPMPIGTS